MPIDNSPDLHAALQARLWSRVQVIFPRRGENGIMMLKQGNNLHLNVVDFYENFPTHSVIKKIRKNSQKKFKARFNYRQNTRASYVTRREDGIHGVLNCRYT